MDTNKIVVDNNLELFVKDIFIMEAPETSHDARLTFFADGYPGVVYLQSEQGYLLPRRKPLTAFFLYGQMIAPYELSIKTPYLMIAFQLYPCAANLLFDVDPRKLNDECVDLSSIQGLAAENPLAALAALSTVSPKIERIAQFIAALACEKGMAEYRKIQHAIQIIEDRKGLITIYELAGQVKTNIRTLRRKFNQYVGIPPKKFAKIIQFQTSLDQISTGEFSKLSDVVYENGYADQSHFIRNIKKFTGKRPMQLRNL